MNLWPACNLPSQTFACCFLLNTGIKSAQPIPILPDSFVFMSLYQAVSFFEISLLFSSPIVPMILNIYLTPYFLIFKIGKDQRWKSFSKISWWEKSHIHTRVSVWQPRVYNFICYHRKSLSGKAKISHHTAVLGIIKSNSYIKKNIANIIVKKHKMN